MNNSRPNMFDDSFHTADDTFGRIEVLLVDDDQDFVSLASVLLESESDRIETTTETSPLTALDRPDLDEVDCIVSDYQMPEMNGIEFLETIREAHPRLPFLLFTGKGGEDVAKRAISAGVSDYIVKDGSPGQYAISANRIENLVMQYRTEKRAVEKQVIDRLTRSVLSAILDESTREAIEQAVCDRLGGSELYSFAWIGEREAQTGEIRARAWSGDEDIFESVSFSTDRGSPQSVEVGALEGGECRVESELVERGQWGAEAERRGFTAAVGVPIVYEGLPYGVLGVYTDWSEGFRAEELEMLELLAELTAFSVGASERRRGDTSRQIIEIEFEVGNTELSFVEIASILGCAVRLTQTAHRSDGTKLTSYALDGTSEAKLRELRTTLDVEEFWVADRPSVGTELAIVSSDPWWEEITRLYGANISEASADGDVGTLSIELPPSSDVRSVVDLIEDRYPNAEPIARRERARIERSIDGLRALLGERLTDRQREVLETAYRLGYYEWPHETSSEAVAERLGISQPTFAEHFWTTQRRIVELLFEVDESETTP